MSGGPNRSGLRAFPLGEGWPYLLTPFIAVAVALEILHGPPAAVFAASALGVIPPAALMGRATEQLADRAGPGIGGLLNVTFGNAPELIIALFALARGLHEVVKATLVGSILGNVLLVLGGAMLWGGLRHDHQRFNRTAANAQSAMLLLAAAALAMPAVFQLVEGRSLPAVGSERTDFSSMADDLSFVVAAILIVTYGFGLVFSLRTHRDLFNPPEEKDRRGAGWSVRRSAMLLGLAGVVVGLMSEILVGSISAAAKSAGLSEFFIGAIIVAIVGNAAEHWVAVLVAGKNRMDLAVNIAIGSSAQVALFVAPVLVLASFAVGPFPMAFVLNGFELAAIFLAVVIANHVTNEGQSTWFEGVQLLAVYAVLVTAFLFA
ncbi:MAG: calcium/proton exchanger [Solirubrobacteraceae bacterium]|jgi:Ca2+:H+ antiporter